MGKVVVVRFFFCRVYVKIIALDPKITKPRVT